MVVFMRNGKNSQMENEMKLEERLRILVPISKKEKDSCGDLFLTISNKDLNRADVIKSVQGLDSESVEDDRTCYYIPRGMMDENGIHVSTSINYFSKWYCNKISELENPEEKINLFIIGNDFYKTEDLRKQDNIREMLDACNVVLSLWKLADIDTGREIMLLTERCTIIKKEFRDEWLFNTHGKASLFINLALPNNPSDEPIKMLLKSEICSELVVFPEEERMMKFGEMFKTIMDNFSFSLGTYMKKNSSTEIKKKFNDMILDTDKKIKDSLGGLKTELAVFLSMYFAMSSFRSSFSPSDIFINKIIIVSLFIVASVYTLILCGDFVSLSDITRSCKETEQEITDRKDEGNVFSKEIEKRIKMKRYKANFYKGVIVIVIFASFAPPVMALFM